MPYNPDNPRIQEMTLEEVQKLLSDLREASKRLQAVRDIMENTGRKSVHVDGKIMAGKSLTRIVRFIGSLSTAYYLET